MQKSEEFHTDAELVTLYKSRLLGYLEYRTAAVYHATDSVLAALDGVQNKLLKVVGCSEVEALLNWKLAPLAMRRDIAMLGLIHRTVTGKGPSHFRRFFRLRNCTAPSTLWTRRAAKRHHRQLETQEYTHCPELLRRSALGLARVYNLLPESVVQEDCVKEFQKKLQELVKKRVEEGSENWNETLSPRVPWWKHPLR